MGKTRHASTLPLDKSSCVSVPPKLLPGLPHVPITIPRRQEITGCCSCCLRNPAHARQSSIPVANANVSQRLQIQSSACQFPSTTRAHEAMHSSAGESGAPTPGLRRTGSLRGQLIDCFSAANHASCRPHGRWGSKLPMVHYTTVNISFIKFPSGSSPFGCILC